MAKQQVWYNDQFGRPTLMENAQEVKPFFESDAYKTMMQQMPGFNGIKDQSGNILDQYSLKAQPDVGFNSNIDDLRQQLSGINLNTDALQALRGEGLRAPGTASPWATMALNQAKSTAGAQGNAQIAGAMSALASRGGVNRGARERIATNGSRGTMMAQQKAGMDIGLQDEANRMDILKALPGMEVQSLAPELQKTSMWANMADTEAGRKQGLDLANRDYTTNVQKTNLTNSIGDLQNKNNYDMSKYEQIMKAYSADRTANAQENAGK